MAVVATISLDDFCISEGFDVIVLSPFVAGVGLTMVEANHVIHYRRWWNPAVESQATDRAYRLGQTKEVHVYLPILWDETKRIARTYDELLEALQKEEFLAPREGPDDSGLRVLEGL